ncbi:peptidase [Aeoliella sp.]|uniref:peptidase n=1 Tax=Aeoliella sp. TaxID=2795800 RepID=UPI003CCB88FE
MTTRSTGGTTRREFCKTAAIGAAGTLALPAIHTWAKTDADDSIVGVDGHQYRVDHQWAQLPDKYHWQTSHNVAVGSDGLIYVIHEGRYDLKDHPAIFVFDADGKFVRAFGEQFQGGGHGIEAKQTAGDDELYVCAYKEQRSFAKLQPNGEQIWRKGAPMESGYYHEGEDQHPRAQGDSPWGRDRFLPTNIAFHPDGSFYVADGYGGWRIHHYDADGNYVSSFGQPGDKKKADGTFNTPHGVWIDSRGDQATVVVADRANARLQWFTLDGKHLRTQDGFLLPANIDTFGELMLVPDLVGRVTLLGGDNKVIAHLGDNSEQMKADSRKAIRGDESRWQTGKFVHPHDACFDADGNIYVAEWVATGRVTKLTRLS